jgi:protein-tyrosine phosphatase
MGNICRSPTAQGVFAKVVEEAGLSHAIQIDSAGTHAYHVGEPPDSRAQETALDRGIDLSVQRARRVGFQDFGYFDYLIAMDRDNLAILRSQCPPHEQHKLSLMMDYAGGRGGDVPDPYYGGPAGFDRVFDMIEDASRGLLERIRREHGL